MGLTETFEALADPLHRDILLLLKKGRLSAGELSAQFCTSPSDMSYHMKKLYEAGLVSRTREKSFVFYEFDNTCLNEALKWIQPSAERLAELDTDE